MLLTPAAAWVLTAFIVIIIAMLLFYMHTLRQQRLTTKQQLRHLRDELSASRSIISQQDIHLDQIERLAKVGSWSLDTATGTLSASDAYLAIYECALSEIPTSGAGFVDRFVDDAAQRQEARENEAKLAAGEAIEGLRRIRVGHNNDKWIEFRNEPRFDSAGTIIGRRGIVRDITEQRLALARATESEASLRLSEENLLRAQRLARIGSWRLDVASGYMDYSAQYQQLFEITPETAPRSAEEWISRFVPDPVEAVAVRQRFHQAIHHGESYQGVRRLVLKDGSARWLSYAADPVIAPDGTVVAIVGATRDITLEHLSQERLKISEERFRLISENMQEVVTLHDAQGRVFYASPSFAHVLGFETDHAEDASPFHYVHPDDEGHLIAVFNRVLSGETPTAKLQLRLRKRAKPETWVESSFVRVLNADASLRHIQAVTRDISQRKRAELELAQRTEELSSTNRLLVAEAARRESLERRVMMSIEGALSQVGLELHDDLGQQLTGISLLVKAMESKLTSTPPQLERSIASEAARITELVNRAINHTRMISHGLSPYMVGDLGLTSALAQLANDIDSLGVVACVAEIDPRVRIQDDVVSRSLFRIAQEATNNSLKHSGAGLIRISLKQVGDDIQLTIGDDGSYGEPSISDVASVRAMGLHSIRHRVQSIGARVKIRRIDVRGTIVLVRWNCLPADKESVRPVQRRLTSVGTIS